MTIVNQNNENETKLNIFPRTYSNLTPYPFLPKTLTHFNIVYRKITWSGRLAQIQIYLEFSRVLSRDQSKCKGNYSVAHKVGRKAKDVS